MIKNLIMKFKRLIRTRIFVNEDILLFKHGKEIECPSSAKIVKASKENISDVLDFQDISYVKKFQSFLSSGDIGFLGYLDNRCVHRSWVKQGPQPVKLHPILSYPLKDGDIFIHYCETAPEARGNHIYPSILSHIVQEYKKKKRILISSEKRNRASIKGISRAGFEEFKQYRVQAFFGIRIITEKL